MRYDVLVVLCGLVAAGCLLRHVWVERAEGGRSSQDMRIISKNRRTS